MGCPLLESHLSLEDTFGQCGVDGQGGSITALRFDIPGTEYDLSLSSQEDAHIRTDWRELQTIHA